MRSRLIRMSSGNTGGKSTKGHLRHLTPFDHYSLLKNFRFPLSRADDRCVNVNFKWKNIYVLLYNYIMAETHKTFTNYHYYKIVPSPH